MAVVGGGAAQASPAADQLMPTGQLYDHMPHCTQLIDSGTTWPSARASCRERIGVNVSGEQASEPARCRRTGRQSLPQDGQVRSSCGARGTK